MTDAIQPDAKPGTSAPNSSLLNSIFAGGLGAFTNYTKAQAAQTNAKKNAQLAAANSASTQKLIILAVIGVVIVGIVFAVARGRR